MNKRPDQTMPIDRKTREKFAEVDAKIDALLADIDKNIKMNNEKIKALDERIVALEDGLQLVSNKMNAFRNWNAVSDE